jgi:hypothetical protein
MKLLITIRIERIINGFIVFVGEDRNTALFCKDMKEVRSYINRELLLLEGQL